MPEIVPVRGWSLPRSAVLAPSTTTPVAVAAPLSASKATTLPGGGTITIVAAKKVSPAARVAAVRRAAPAGPAVLSACVAAAAMPCQQRRAAVAAQGGSVVGQGGGGPTGPGENSAWDLEIEGTRSELGDLRGGRVTSEESIVWKTEEKVKLIRDRLQVASDRQKSYADLKRLEISFDVGDKVFLKVSPWRRVLRFGKRGKLSPRFIRPYPVTAKVGPVAYQLVLE
ncbi:unnamed protein product [Cuscuta campestris]|uniref:Tf2-1-like SH3-like domain-containing protein n=1 Tax=Cuscuta campestris TaxID=132261 RepID=A0A484M282_9ASTE|nr:unnamed protein product [Cuscuta campestris]